MVAWERVVLAAVALELGAIVVSDTALYHIIRISLEIPDARTFTGYTDLSRLLFALQINNRIMNDVIGRRDGRMYDRPFFRTSPILVFSLHP